MTKDCYSSRVTPHMTCTSSEWRPSYVFKWRHGRTQWYFRVVKRRMRYRTLRPTLHALDQLKGMTPGVELASDRQCWRCTLMRLHVFALSGRQERGLETVPLDVWNDQWFTSMPLQVKCLGRSQRICMSKSFSQPLVRTTIAFLKSKLFQPMI